MPNLLDKIKQLFQIQTKQPVKAVMSSLPNTTNIKDNQ